jgi:tetratricopeptide (TPR) repeat protein
MEKQQDIIGYVGLGISSVGAIASVITNNIALASLPLTVGVACNLISRKQFNDSLVEAYNTQQQSINDLIHKIEDNQNQISEKLIENKTEFNNSLESTKQSLGNSLDEQKENLLQEIKRVDLQHQELSKVVNNLKNVENISKNLTGQDDSPEFFYDRGVSYEQLGNKEGAVKDYTEAVKLDSSLAKAYHRRGVIYLDIGDRQKAVDDLRKAALLYFEQGDIDSYHQAREMSRNIHDLKAMDNGKAKEMVSGSNLFS